MMYCIYLYLFASLPSFDAIALESAHVGRCSFSIEDYTMLCDVTAEELSNKAAQGGAIGYGCIG